MTTGEIINLKELGHKKQLTFLLRKKMYETLYIFFEVLSRAKRLLRI